MKKGWKALSMGWKRLANLIGRIQTRVLLTLAYVFVVSPTWVLMNVLDKNPFKNRRTQNADYWQRC